MSDPLNSVPGWLSEVEGRALSKLAAGKEVLEIGAYCGRSTIYMARTASWVHTIDTFDGRTTPDPRDTIDEFLENLTRYEVIQRVSWFKGTIEEAFSTMTGKFDMIFVDGAHDLASVRRDISLTIPFLKPASLLVCHDYDVGDGWSFVKPAVDEFIISGRGELIDLIEGLAVVRTQYSFPLTEEQVREQRCPRPG